MDELRIKEEEGQLIDVYLQPHTEVFERRKRELIGAGMSENEAETWLHTTPIQLELFYSTNQGLFGVEPEALDNIEIYNPYTGEEIPNDNLN